jgi:cell division protein FtsB
LRYWGTEDNVSRSGKTGKASRRPARKPRREAERSAPSGRAAGGRSASRSGGGRPGSRQTVATGGSVKNYPFLRQFYRHQTALSNRLQRLLFFLIMAALIYVFFLGDSGAIKITQLRLQRARLDKNIAELKHNSEQLETTIARLKSEDFYIEKIGRERYGYVRPGERVYKIIPIDEHDF